MSPWWVRLSRGYRARQLRVKQKLAEIRVEGSQPLERAVAAGNGVLVAANHSTHYDSAALYIAGDRIGQPLYFMTAWQVFGMSNLFERWAMQRLGCFSVDREGNDRQAFKQAVQILQEQPYPLVIFPEGDIYHTTDHVTTFREGAAAIALAAAKRAARPVVVIPCGIKFWYVDDPTEQLVELTARLEDRLFLRAAPDARLQQRIHRLAEAALALKELDYLGQTRSGRLRERVVFLTDAVLTALENRHGLQRKEDRPAPERVKVLRQHVIRLLEESQNPPGEASGELAQLRRDMEDLFFAMQLFSYRGDYLVGQPSVERLAETLDKFEEDVLRLDLPTVRGRRRVVIRFGEPITCVTDVARRDAVADLTRQMHDRVQAILDDFNAV